MPTARVLDALHVLVRPPDDCSDGDFLRRFLADRDEAAFAELVRRHGPLVYGTCRRVLGGGAEADDAFQATFFVLARKAASIRRTDAVAGWLYAVAVKVAHKARGQAVKRRVRHMAAARPEAVHPVTPTDDLWAVLDDELAKLPADLREAVLACDVGGKSRAQAARDLGWPEGTVAKRLAKAREQLAKRLTRRGISLSVPALAAALAEGATAAVPGPLLAATAAQAAAFAVGSAGTVAVRSLAEGVLRTLKVGAFKAWLLVGLLGATLAGGGLMLAGGPPAGGHPEVPNVAASAPVPKPPVADWTEKPPLELPGRLPVSVAYSADGKTTVVGDTEGKVTAFDTATQKKRWEAAVGGSHAAVACSADGKAVYATFKDGVRMLDAATGKLGESVGDVGGEPLAVGVFRDELIPTNDVHTRSQVVVGTARGYAVKSWVAGKLATTTGTIQAGTVPKTEQPADEYAVPLAVDPAGRCAIMTGPRDANTKKNVLWAYVCGNYEPDSPGNRLMPGHAAIVVSAAWSKDGTTAVTGDKDGRVIVWDGKTMKEKHRLELSGRVAALAITADAKQIAAVVVSGTAAGFSVWDAAKKDMPKPIYIEGRDFDGGKVFASLAFSPDGRQLSGCVGNRTWLNRLGELVGKVHVWEAAAGKAGPVSWREGKPFADLPGWPVSSLSVSPDGKMLAVVHGNTVSIHDPLTQARLDKGRVGQLKARATRPAVAFSPAGRLAVTAQNGVVVFDQLRDEVPRIVGDAGVWEGVADVDPHRVAWLDDADGVERLFVTNGARTEERHVVGGKRQDATAWDAWKAYRHQPAVLAAAPGRGRVLFSFNNGREEAADPFDVSVLLTDARPPTLRRLSGHAARPVCGAVSPDGTLFLTGDAAGGLIAWDGQTFARRRQWQLGGTIANVAVAADNKTAAVLRAAEANGATAWELFVFDPTDPPATLTPTWQATLPGSYSNPELPVKKPDGTTDGPAFASLAFHPNGTTLFGSLAEPYVRTKQPTALRVWEKAAPPTSRRDEPVLQGVDVHAAVWSPDGQTFAVGERGGRVSLWDARTHAKRWTSEAFDAGASASLSFSPDGADLALGDGRRVVFLKAATGQAFAEWNDYPSTAVAYWPSQKRLIGTDGLSLTARPLPPAGADVRAGTGTGGGGVGRLAAGVALQPNGPSFAYVQQATDKTPLSGAAVSLGAKDKELLAHTGACFAVAWSPDGKTIATGGDDGKIVLWSGAEFADKREVQTDDASVRTLAFGPDGKTLYAGSALAAAVSGWDVAAGTVRFRRPVRGPAVTALALSPDGRSLLVATGDPFGRDTADGRVEVWPTAAMTEPPAATRREVAALRPKKDTDPAPQAVAFAPDGKAFAVSDTDGTVTLWDAATLKQLWTNPANGGQNYSALDVAPDGGEIAVATGDSVRYVDAKTGATRRTAADRKMYAVAYSRDGRRVAESDSLLVGATGAAWQRLTDRTGPLGIDGKLSPCPLAWSPDGTRVAVLCQPTGAVTAGNVALWEPARNRKEYLEQQERLEVLYALRWTRDGKHLLAGGDGGRLLVWSGAAFDKRREIRTGGWNVRALALSPDGRTVYAGLTRTDKKVRSAAVKGFDLETGEVMFTRTIGGATAFSLAVAPDGRSLVVASGVSGFELDDTAADHAGARVEVWAMPAADPAPLTWKADEPITDPQFDVRSLAVSPDGRRFAVGTGGQTWVYDTATRQKQYAAAGGFPRFVGTELFTWSARPARYDAAAGTETKRFPETNRPDGTASDWTLAAISPDGGTVAGFDGNDVSVRDLTTGIVQPPLAGQGVPKDGRRPFRGGVAWSPDGTRLAGFHAAGPLGSAAGLRVWSIKTRGTVAVLPFVGHTAGTPEPCFAYSPDGTALVIGGKKNATTSALTVADSSSLKDRVSPVEITSRDGGADVTAVAFAADGGTIAAGVKLHTGKGPLHRVHLYDAQTLQLRDTLLPAPDTPTITAVAFTPDGHTLIAATGDGPFADPQKKEVLHRVLIWRAGPAQSN